MRIVALGTGDALNGGGRGHTCFLVEDEQGAYLVDAGAQVLMALQKAGADAAQLGAVHFTHLHGDHLAGWPFLLLDLVYRCKRTSPLVVTGPTGTRERLEALWAACYADTAKRPLPFALEVLELEPGSTHTILGRKVEVFRAQHMRAPHVALSLKITSEQCLAFTGDTGPHEGIVELARGAELLLGECTELITPAHDAGSASAGAERGHLSWDDWKVLLPRLPGVPVRLVHLGAEMRAQVAVVAAEGGALGDVWALEDGDEIDV